MSKTVFTKTIYLSFFSFLVVNLTENWWKKLCTTLFPYHMIFYHEEKDLNTIDFKFSTYYGFYLDDPHKPHVLTHGTLWRDLIIGCITDLLSSSGVWLGWRLLGARLHRVHHPPSLSVVQVTILPSVSAFLCLSLLPWSQLVMACTHESKWFYSPLNCEHQVLCPSENSS